jgi:hypothetical protein
MNGSRFYDTFDVGTTPVLIAGYNPQRTSIVISTDGTAIVVGLAGNVSAVAPIKGLAIPANGNSGSMFSSESAGLSAGPFYAVTAAGAARVTVFEGYSQ